MKSPKLHIFLVIGSLLSIFFLTSCSQSNPDESELPWSQPAEWEGRAPGFGGQF